MADGKTKIDAGAWVVVCDGAKALILENAGDAKFLNLRTLEALEQENPPTRDQGAGAPGRVHQLLGAARSAVEQTDWHARAEQNFLESLAQRLHQAVAAGAPKSLILIAPPTALGVLRKSLTPQVRSVVAAEIARDYVNLAVHEIERRLAA